MGKWTEYHFLRLSVNPPNEHASRITKALEDALAKLFGTSRARTYIDVLWISEKGDEVIVRVGQPDAQAVKAAVVVTSLMRLSLVQSSDRLEDVVPEGATVPNLTEE